MYSRSLGGKRRKESEDSASKFRWGGTRTPSVEKSGPGLFNPAIKVNDDICYVPQIAFILIREFITLGYQSVHVYHDTVQVRLCIRLHYCCYCYQ